MFIFSLEFMNSSIVPNSVCQQNKGLCQGPHDLCNNLYISPSWAVRSSRLSQFSRHGHDQGTNRHVGVHFHLHTAFYCLFRLMQFLHFARGGSGGVLLKDAQMSALRLSTSSTAVSRAMRGSRICRHGLVVSIGKGRAGDM